MKAVVQEKYGPPDRLTLCEIDRPPVADDGVLVRVQAASVNPADFHMIRGEPFPARLMVGGPRALRRPTHPVPGTDGSAYAAHRTSISSARSGPTTSSTTRRKTSPATGTGMS